jgi:hypothetical protein
VAGVLSVEIVSEFLTSDDGREATTDPADRVAT